MSATEPAGADDRTTGELLEHLEWSYNTGRPFDAEVVWELARRASNAEAELAAGRALHPQNT